MLAALATHKDTTMAKHWAHVCAKCQAPPPPPRRCADNAHDALVDFLRPPAPEKKISSSQKSSRGSMEHHRPQHHSEWSHRSTTTTTTTIAGLSWPPLRSASFLKEGYSGLASSLCLDFDPLWWSTHQVRAHGGGTGKAPITLATIHKRLSAAAPPVPPFSRRKENSSFRSGELQAPSRSGPTVRARFL